MKSLQNMVDEAMGWQGEAPATGNAFSQARQKLTHTALIELNEAAVVGTLYTDGDNQTYRGLRVLDHGHTGAPRQLLDFHKQL